MLLLLSYCNNIEKSIYFLIILQFNNNRALRGVIMTLVNKTIGKRIKELRIEQGLNQTEFGKMFHLSQNDITNIENGKKTISYDALLDIANKFGVSTDYLIKENGVKYNNPDLQFICDYTGLNEKTISLLNSQNNFEKSICQFFEEQNVPENEYKSYPKSIVLKADLNFIDAFILWLSSATDLAEISIYCTDTEKFINEQCSTEIKTANEAFECISSITEESRYINGTLYNLNNAFMDFIQGYFNIKTIKNQLSEIQTRATQIVNNRLGDIKNGKHNTD